ncbi:MAG: iron ABC transporter permease [Deltaproteobacteria bacterium]|nr:iron ABC transporter permease [Deltaproteobacteria bacterium]
MTGAPGPSRRRRLVVIGLGVVVLGFVVALIVGMPAVDLARALGDPESPDRRSLLALQLPRIVQGLAVGAVLAVAGAALQGLLRNPLADPHILGVSGGAALGSALLGLFGAALGLAWPFALEPIGGFVGALAALAIVLALGSERGVPSPLRMLLVGVVVNALAGALLMVLASLGDAMAVRRTLLRLMGSLGADPSAPWLVPVTVAAAALALLVVIPRARALDLLALGDETAASLGLDPARLRRRLFVWLSLPVGAVVAVTGLIGFAGLVVPHAVRLVVGPDHRLVVPLSACFGAAFLAVADAVVSRAAGALGNELPVGVVTALVGGPVFLVMLRARLREAPT